MRRNPVSGRLPGAVSAVAVAATLLLTAPSAVAAATLEVCTSGCPYSDIGAALAAAKNGDTIIVGAGTYAGGFTIATNVTLLGAGAGQTIVSGGGPVVTIGAFGAKVQPNVTLEGFTITGGVTTGSPVSEAWVGETNVIALGGGIEITPNADWTGGAKVTIRHSEITGNSVAPTDTLPFGPPCPGGVYCEFAWAKGGGIDNWGSLSLVDTTVSDNTAGGAASDADGGGIATWPTGSLSLDHTRVVGNQAIAGVPDGRFAEGGGIFVGDGVRVTIADSSVNGNTASLTSLLPYDVGGGDTLDMNANGGGVHTGNGGILTVLRSEFRDNSVTLDDPNGQPYAFDAAIAPGDGPLTIIDSLLTGNDVEATVGSSADVGPSGSAIDISGPTIIRGTRIINNTTRVVSSAGDAQASGAVFAANLSSQPALISDSLIEGNLTEASSTSGSASVLGSGILNEASLVLKGVTVAGNVASVHAPSGTALGGGIWNGQLFDDAAQLTIKDSTVTGNTLEGDTGSTLAGGGLYTEYPVVLQHTTISGNVPDDCVGC